MDADHHHHQSMMDAPPPPPLDHKLYLIVSVALATVSFFINAIQLAALIRHNLLAGGGGGGRNVLLLSQTIAGLATTFTVVYPIKLVTGRHRSHWHDPDQPDVLSDFAACLGLGSGLYLLAVFLAVTNSTLDVLLRYLAVAHPHSYRHLRDDYVSLTACITAAWVETTLFALMPWLGWNAWTGQCLMPDMWAPGFTALLAATLCAHVASETVMVAKMWLVLRRRAYAVNPESEEMPIAAASSLRSSASAIVDREPPLRRTSAVGLCTVAYATTVLCHAPLLVHWAAYAGRPADDPSRTDTFLWTSLLLLVNAVVNPLLNAFGGSDDDDQLAKPSLDLLKLCCGRALHRSDASP